VDGLKHQKEKRSMDHFAGLDVSVKETSVCIVDDTGKIVREVKVPSEPKALLKVLTNPAYRFGRLEKQTFGPRPPISVSQQSDSTQILTHRRCPSRAASRHFRLDASDL
jgi:hypothetical protein